MEPMNTGPSKLAETVVTAVVPPACSEEVLGDLHERYTSPLQYALDAIFTVPMVVASRIRRTADPQMVLLEAMAMYLAYLVSAWYWDQTFLVSDQGLMLLAIPAATSLLMLIVGDAYARAGKASQPRILVSAILGVGIPLLTAIVPVAILICGSISSAVLTLALRLMFPPLTKKPQAAGAPELRQRETGDVRSSIGPNGFWPIAIATLLWVLFQFRKHK
jgi:hypothetical protein